MIVIIILPTVFYYDRYPEFLCTFMFSHVLSSLLLYTSVLFHIFLPILVFSCNILNTSVIFYIFLYFLAFPHAYWCSHAPHCSLLYLPVHPCPSLYSPPLSYTSSSFLNFIVLFSHSCTLPIIPVLTFAFLHFPVLPYALMYFLEPLGTRLYFPALTYALLYFSVLSHAPLHFAALTHAFVCFPALSYAL